MLTIMMAYRRDCRLGLPTLDRLGRRFDVKTYAPVFLQILIGAGLCFTKVDEHFPAIRFLGFPCFHRYNSLYLLFILILWTHCHFLSYRDCRQCFSSGSISKRIPQVSGKDLNALAGAVPTRMNTVLLLTFLDNQRPFLSCIVQNPFYTTVCFKIASY